MKGHPHLEIRFFLEDNLIKDRLVKDQAPYTTSDRHSGFDLSGHEHLSTPGC